MIVFSKAPVPQGAGAFCHMRQILLAIFLLLVAQIGHGSDLTVDAAYRAIPHQRTAFDATASTLPMEHRAALARLFALTDRGVVLRVRGMMALASEPQKELRDVIEEYGQLTASIVSMPTPPDIKPTQELVVQSVRLHQRFFANQLDQSNVSATVSRDVKRNREVREASQMLHAAYGRLMSSFPNEAAINRQAFYDHLCALDFL